MDSNNQDMNSSKKESPYCEKCMQLNQDKPEHHLTSDIYIRYRGHKSECQTHCPHKDTNMQTSDIHDEKENK